MAILENDADAVDQHGAQHAKEPVEQLNRSALRTSDLLIALGDHPDGASAAELAVHTGIPRPTAFRLLLSLTHAGLLERDGGTFALSWKVARLGRVADPYRGILPRIQVVLDRLAADFNEAVHYSAVTGPTSQDTIAEADGPHLLSPSQRYVGMDFPLHASATGKLLLAHLSDEEVVSLLSERLEPITKFTITSRDLLLVELREVRAKGYVTLDNELEEGLFAVAVPVYDDAERFSGVLATSGLDQRMKSANVYSFVRGLQEAASHLSGTISLGN